MTRSSGARASRLEGLRGAALVAATVRRAVLLAGLTGVALTQPLLGVFGDNPEFFVAGRYGAGQIVMFALAVAVVPPLIGAVAVTAASFIDRRAGDVVFAVVVAVLAYAFGLVLLRSLGADAVVVVVVTAAVFAAGATYLLMRVEPVRLFVSYLAAANLLFVGLFLFTSSASALVTDRDLADDVGAAEVPPVDAPVVVVVFDELPAASIMDADGDINAERYPGFAELAESSTWYRNASSPSPETQSAITALLTGARPEPGLPGTYIDYPANLFTMLGADLPIERYEAVTTMCPPEVCDPAPPRPLRQALGDAAIVYGHRVLPASLREDLLPPIDDTWGGFADDRDGGDDERADEVEDVMRTRWIEVVEEGTDPVSQASIFGRQIQQITESPAFHYTHVLFPHYPWVMSASGAKVSAPQDWRAFTRRDGGEPGHEFRRRTFQQLHAMQVGAVDVMLTELLDRLQALPNWEDVLLVVAADHGAALAGPDLGRNEVTDANLAEVHRVPLFIKAPGQVDGEISDDSTETIDVVPSIVDLLDIETGGGWELEGRSIYDDNSASSDPVVSEDVGEVLELAERYNEPFAHGDDWTGLAAVGDHGDLIGEQVDALDVGAPSEHAVSLDDRELFDSLPADGGTMPLVLTGSATGPGDGPPPELLVAINGELAGVVGGYRPDGDDWEFIGYVADRYREGRNEVELYEVETGNPRGEVTLRSVG